MEAVKITLQQKIEMARIYAGMSKTEVGSKLGMSQSSFTKRVDTGKFTQEELESMAAAMGAEWRSGFYFPDGKAFD